MARLLLVDDEPGMLFALKALTKQRRHEAVLARSAQEALAQLEGVDAVVTDYAMPEMDGVQLLQAIHERDESLPVILLTAHGSERIAVRAMKTGAYEYVTKPFDIEEMGLVIERALEARALRVQNRRLTAEKAIGRSIVGDSAAMRRLIDAVTRVAPRDITVLVRGETGTGKELVAALIHGESKRAKGPLVRFNCAAIPGELAEAELFGHSRGAFTGATQARRGFFAEADGGTLVLDEVGELPLPVQANFFARCRKERSSPSARGASSTSTCASSPARIAIWRRMRAMAASGRTSTTGWPWWSSGCRRCTSIARTFPPWRWSSHDVMPSDSGWRARAYRPRSSRSCAWRSGRATCASSRTPWRGSSRSAPEGRSGRRR